MPGAASEACGCLRYTITDRYLAKITKFFFSTADMNYDKGRNSG